jgi:Tautomerase enzyme
LATNFVMIVANTQVTDCASRSSPAHINRKSLTPLAHVDLPAGKPPEYGRAVADAVHNAMIATLNAPKDDRFHVISEVLCRFTTKRIA